MDMPALRLNPRRDVDRLAAAFAAEGRVRVDGLLPEADAYWWRQHLQARTDWRQVMNSGDKVFELDRPTLAAMDEAQKRALDDAVHAGARTGFQYRFETVRVPDAPDARQASDDPLARFAEWMGGGAVLDLCRKITGRADIEFADAQATAYAPGDFLTAHDDDVAGKGRRAAYVFGLSTPWRPEWGGLLLFHRGDAVDGFVPAFNTLNLFAVPQLHSVSQVTRAAPARRYSITGWLRRSPGTG